MLNRRTWLVAAAGGLLTSACATGPPPLPLVTLADVLSALETVKTVAELTEKVGKPNYERVFDYDNPSSPDFYARQHKSQFYTLVVTPPDLIDTAPKGSRMLEYDFTARHTDINPPGALVLVLADDQGNILGWMRRVGVYLGKETEAVRVPVYSEVPGA